MDHKQAVGQLGLSDRWLSVGEVCEYLGVSRDTVYRWIHNRQLPGRSVGRLWKFKKHEIDCWVAAGGVR